MGFQVKVLPSGHQFSSEGRSSVLRAGLREGVNLDHNCANGSCGECRARLLEGSLERIRHHDFRLSVEEQQAGWFLMCCHHAVTDLVISTHESDQAGDIPEQHITAKVSRIELLKPDVVQLTVRTPRSKGLHFLAGQQVQLHFDGMRPLTLPVASCPCDSIQLRFHVRRRAEDPITELLFGRLGKGREVVVSGPTGSFTLDEESQRPIVFVAWETGFAPVASLIDHVIQKDPDREIQLYWMTGIADGHYLANHCRAWEDALDRFTYKLVTLGTDQKAEVGVVLADMLKAQSKRREKDYYLVLPGALQDATVQLFLDQAVPLEQVHISLQNLP